MTPWHTLNFKQCEAFKMVLGGGRPEMQADWTVLPFQVHGHLVDTYENKNLKKFNKYGGHWP